jgi:hypothetical protein
MLKVGTLVLVIRTGTGLDGATGVVIAGLAKRSARDMRTGMRNVLPRSYIVRTSRITPWGETFVGDAACLVPISPPGSDQMVERDAPVHLAGVV